VRVEICPFPPIWPNRWQKGKFQCIRRRFLFNLILTPHLSLINITLIKINDYKLRSERTNIFCGDWQRSMPTAVKTARQNGDEKQQPCLDGRLDGRPSVSVSVSNLGLQVRTLMYTSAEICQLWPAGVLLGSQNTEGCKKL